MRPFPLILLFALPVPALAQGFDAHGFQLATHDGDLRDSLTMVRPAPWHGGDVYFGTLLEYANKPLVEVITAGGEATDTSRAVIRDLGVVNVSSGFAPLDHWRLDVSFPVYVVSTDAEGTVGDPAPGDIRLQSTVNLLRPEHIEGGTGLGVGLTGNLDLPLGSDERFLGRGGIAGGLMATVGYEADVAHVTAGAGVQFNPGADVGNLTGSDAFVGSIAAGVLAGRTTGINLEARVAPELSKNELAGAGMPGEAILSLKQQGPSNTYFTFGFAKAFAAGAGAADFRGFVGWGIGHRDPPRPPDFDGIEAPLAVLDACPAEWETDNGWLDDDGCADDLGSLTVRVLYQDEPWSQATLAIEGIEATPQKHLYAGKPLTFDKAMPGTIVHATATTEACLEGEGEVEVGEGPAELRVDLKRVLGGMVEVEVVTQKQDDAEPPADGTSEEPPAEVVPADGEAPIDDGYEPVPGATVTFHSDQPLCIPEGAMLLDDASRGRAPIGPGTHAVTAGAPDFKIHEAEFEVAAGEPTQLRIVLERIPPPVVIVEVKAAPTRVKIEKKRIRIDDKIYFEVNKAVIKEESYGLLDEIADVVMDNPDVGRVEIGGHTDSQGGDAYNLGLSVRRASSVRSYLIARGISPDRLEAAGYGETKPIATNDTPEGREQNRRVEFLLMDRQDEEEGEP